MRTASTPRGVSTAVDVTLALLLVSASVAVVVTFYEPSEPEPNPDSAEQTAELFAATTLQVDYSLKPVAEDEYFDADTSIVEDILGDDGVNEEALDRTAHGPVTDLLASAAATRVSVEASDVSGGRPISMAGEDFVAQMEGDIRNILTRSSSAAHVVAVWRPYEGSAMQGIAEVGPKPPEGADVSVARMQVQNRMAPVADGEVSARYTTDGFDGVAELLAHSVVTGYFDPEEDQLALEGNGFEAAYAGYRYQRWQTVLNSWGEKSSALYPGSPGTDAGVDYRKPFLHSTVNFIGSNRPRARQAATEVEHELAHDFEDELADQYPSDITGAELAEKVTVDEVTIIVQTW